jgi:hypothetical protein
MTQLRRIEAEVQVREQRALLRLDGPKRRGRKPPARRKAATGTSDSNLPETSSRTAARSRTRKPRP